MNKLSQRLQTILDHSLKGMPFWDLCCDHGQLGVQALAQGVASEVHFVDQVDHIMQSLQSRGVGYQQRVHLHLLPAEEIKQVLTGNVVIAGVGGNTLVKILNSLDVNSFLQADRILLNPATRKSVLDDFLQAWGAYKLKEQLSFTEGGIERSVYILDRVSN